MILYDKMREYLLMLLGRMARRIGTSNVIAASVDEKSNREDEETPTQSKPVAISDGPLHAVPAFGVLTFEYKVAETLA